MSKILLSLSFLGLAFLAIGTVVAPQAPAFWLASGAGDFERVRIILMIVLLLQLVTKPPRHRAFRVLAGAIAFCTGVWVWNLTYNYHMPFLDTLAFAAAAIAIGVTALERRIVLNTPPVRTARFARQ